jgi:hypothetical protein
MKYYHSTPDSVCISMRTGDMPDFRKSQLRCDFLYILFDWRTFSGPALQKMHAMVGGGLPKHVALKEHDFHQNGYSAD